MLMILMMITMIIVVTMMMVIEDDDTDNYDDADYKIDGGYTMFQLHCYCVEETQTQTTIQRFKLRIMSNINCKHLC